MSQEYKHYTVGFAFNEDKTEVILIKKCKPEWQNGYLNGVGGRLESGESIVDCMEREFREETGLRIRGWKYFLSGDICCHQGNCIVEYFTVIAPDFTPKFDSNEQAGWYTVATVKKHRIVPNLAWMLEMALLKHNVTDWEEPAKWTTV